jgi:pyruvate dehydrogenase kinase 2/3/4
VQNEFQVRLAHMVKEIDSCPGELKQMPSISRVRSWCVQSFTDLLEFPEFSEDPSLGPNDPTIQRIQFANLLDDIMERHAPVMVTLAEGIRELKLKASEAILAATEGSQKPLLPPVQEFLGALVQIIPPSPTAPSSDPDRTFTDRFHMCRIGIRALGKHYLKVFGAPQIDFHEDRTIVGIIDRRCDIAIVANDAAMDARDLCERAFGRPAPDVEISLPRGDATVAYVPSHLHFALFELLKNALRATVEWHERTGLDRPLPPVRITAVRGTEEDVSIKISDFGGGIARSFLPQLYSYTFTTYDRPTTDNSAPIAGFGYGLPLARLYARYFGGEVQLMSMEGLGTDAFVFLKASPASAQEVLPVSVDRRGLARWYQYMKVCGCRGAVCEC